jgi:hypothetical protein
LAYTKTSLLWVFAKSLIHVHLCLCAKIPFSGWNMKVCIAMGVVQLLAWAIWAGVTRHPSRFKLWIVVFGGALAMLLEVYDFPPYKGYADAHSLWHASTIPLTYLWWSFIKDDAEFRTATLVKKAK